MWYNHTAPLSVHPKGREKFMNEKTKIKGQLGLYLQWPLFLGTLVILTNIAVAAFSAAAGLTMSIFTLLYFVTAVFLYAYKRK